MIDSAVRDEAALWMARSRDPRFSDWDALTEWLEADPVHNLAYEQAFAGHELAGALDTPLAESPAMFQADVRHRRWGLRAIGGAITGTAAAASAIFLLVAPYSAGSAERVAETRPGEHRLVHLQDGTQIALNGDTRLVLDSTNGRTARLERGEAMFTVVHNETRPFTVDAGGVRMVDLGTRFNVLHSERGSEVAVAEGAVLYDPGGAAVRLGAGRVLRKGHGTPIVELSQTDPGLIGGWRSGHLAYRDAPLWRVADDLSRATGTSIAVDPDLAQRYFTGALSVSGMKRAALTTKLGALLDVAVAQRPEGLYLSARAIR